MNPWLDNLIKEARSGNDLAGRALAGFMVEALEKGEIPPALGEYFCHALRRIARGGSADSELNTARKGTRAKFERDCEIARKVWHLNHRAVDRLPLRDSASMAGAYDIVAGEYGLGADRVEQIYEKMRWLVEAEAFEMMAETMGLEGQNVPAEHLEEWLEVRRRGLADMHAAFKRLFDALKK